MNSPQTLAVIETTDLYKPGETGDGARGLNFGASADEIWQYDARDVLTTYADLEQYLPTLGVTGEDEQASVRRAIEKVGLKIPRLYLVDLIDSITTDLERRQIRNFVVPQVDEAVADHTPDLTTFLDQHSVDNNPRKGLTRMYTDRVLLSPVHNCSVHCTWCFRDMGAGSLSAAQLEDVYAYVEGDNRITDVVITGGEPLLLNDHRIDSILTRLRQIEHVEVIRFHTRVPVAVPSRITDAFVEMLHRHTAKGKPMYFVTQYIHPNELTERSTDAVYKLVQAGIYVYNQAPVLRGVSDDQETFNRLLKTMVRYQVRPYYAITTIIKDGLNSRFFVPFEEVSELVNAYSARYDGLGRPTIIVPVMGRKISPTQLKAEMLERGAYVRNTKSEIWKGTK